VVAAPPYLGSHLFPHFFGGYRQGEITEIGRKWYSGHIHPHFHTYLPYYDEKYTRLCHVLLLQDTAVCVPEIPVPKILEKKI
jgi:hypothetical protein